ncbi:winged helix-turn-helix transcriptional regulator, partial [Pseudolactococcus reticulitermitis]
MKNMTVTELSEAFGVTRQAMNNRIKKLEEEFLAKNDRGVTVVNEAGIKQLETHYGKVILEDESTTEKLSDKNAINIDFDKIISQLIEDKNTEITRLSE